MKLRLSIATLTSFLIVGAGCQFSSDEQDLPQILSQVEMEIVNTSINKLIDLGWLPYYGVYVVSDTTIPGLRIEELVQDGTPFNKAVVLTIRDPGLLEWDPLQREILVARFIESNANGGQFDIERFLLNAGDVNLIMPETFKSYFKTGTLEGWRIFYELHPGANGYTRISRPAISSELGLALIHIDHFAGAIGGAGYYVLLYRKDGRWHVPEYGGMWSDWVS